MWDIGLHAIPCNTVVRLLSLPSTENPYHRMLNPRDVRHIPWPSAGRSNAVEMKVDRTLVHVVDDNATFRKTIGRPSGAIWLLRFHLSLRRRPWSFWPW